jgi:hypothetical protein
MVNFLKLLFIFFSTNAGVERSFSVNKQCLVKNLLEQSLIGQRIVYDAVKEKYNFDLEKLDITHSMIQYFKGASAKRVQYLQTKQESENKLRDEKKRLNQEVILL